MKKFILVSLILVGLILSGSNVSANTVSIYLEGVAADTDISTFQFLFYTPDSTYGYPLAYDYNTDLSDFSISWGSGQPTAGWQLEDYPIIYDSSVGTYGADYASGYGAYTTSPNPAFWAYSLSR